MSRPVVLLLALLAVACGTASGGSFAPSSSTPAAQSGAACPIAIPERPFVAPAPFPAAPPTQYKSAWYGDANLWTMIAVDGERWHDLPHHSGGLVQKTFWWSTLWLADGEFQPAISVAGQRLDAPGSLHAGPPGTNASADFGTAMLVGVVVPAPGCWRLTATYRSAQLSIVVLVND